MFHSPVGKLGVLLLLVGAVLLVGPTVGFSSIVTDREVVADTAAAPDALLGIEETSETPDNQNDAVVVEIHNNAGTDFDELAADVTLDTNRLAVSDDLDDSLDEGETTGLELTCEQGGDGEATVAVEVNASGLGLRIEDVTFEHTFQYSCTGGGGDPGGFESVDAGNVVGPGPTSQTFSFTMDEELPGGETVTIDVTAIGATYDSANIGDVDGSHQHDEATFVDRDGGSATIEFDPHNRVQGGEEVTITVENVEIDSFTFIGWATFAESAGGDETIDFFSIDAAGSAGLTTSTASADGPVPLTESDIETILDESGEFDDRKEILEFVEEANGVEYVEEP